jgi:glycopeptide antibiotics resistance protein
VSPLRTSDTGPAVTWCLWLMLALVIVAASVGRWAPDGPGIWAPLLVSPRDAALNMLAYVPFGVVGMFALRRTDARGVARVTAIAALFSLSIETLQLYTIDRVGSVTDVVWAVAGTAAGALGVRWWASR